MHRNTIIIGSGISGLYCAYSLIKKGLTSLVVLDKNDYIGGRIKYSKFGGECVALGAGIIAPDQVNTLRMLDELGIGYGKKENNINSNSFRIYNSVKKILENCRGDEIFNNVMKDHVELFDCVNRYSVFKDYFNMKVSDVLKSGLLEDGLSIREYFYYTKWSVVIDKLIEKVGRNNIHLMTNVTSIDKLGSSNIKIMCENGIRYWCNEVVLCCDMNINSVDFCGFLPKSLEILKHVKSEPTIRVYTYHKEHNIDKMLVVNGANHKIIPISPNILITAYSDNDDAREIKLLIENKEDYWKYIQQSIEWYNDKYNTSYSISAPEKYKMHFWEYGYHYHSSSDIVTDNYRSDNIVILGEYISIRNGWIDSAIRTVDDFIKNL